MSVAHDQCPFCDQQFKGEPSPRTVGENAFLQCSAHVWAKHADKMFNCPRDDRQAYWRHGDQTCSYCGSISPETFLLLSEGGTELTPTDKNYKVYIGGKKFYFAHLNSDQRMRFANLLLDRKVVMSMGFYVLPFFMGGGAAC